MVDLPGYGYAKIAAGERQRWDSLINGYFSQQRDVRLLIQLLDCRHAPSADDQKMLEYLTYYKIPFVAALTKADKCKPSQHAKIMEDFTQRLSGTGCLGIYLTSAEKGTGIEALAEAMQAACPVQSQE